MEFDNLQLNTQLTSSLVNSVVHQAIDKKLENERVETAANDALLTEQTQSTNITSTVVRNLLG